MCSLRDMGLNGTTTETDFNSNSVRSIGCFLLTPGFSQVIISSRMRNRFKRFHEKPLKRRTC